MSGGFDVKTGCDANTGPAVRAGFHWPVRIYWEDTDAGGVVYYANYLRFMERARSEWLRTLGFEQDELRDQLGVVFVVRRVEVDYLSPARFNDSINVEVKLHQMGQASFSVDQLLTRGPTRLVSARVTLACVDVARFKPVKIPAPLLLALTPLT